MILIFIFGTLIGSFLNCLIYRLEKKKTFVSGRSFCVKCKKELVWYDLIPIFSYLFLLGKCRYCKKKISIQYPLVEIATGLLFMFVFSWNIVNTILLFIIVSLLLVVFVYDLKHFLIPDKIVYPGMVVAIIYQIFNYSNIYWLFAGLGAGLLFYLIYAVSRGKWLGFGDVKLVIFLGLFLGCPLTGLALFFSFIIGAIIGIGLIIFKGKGLKTQVPFAPFLVLGTFVSFFWGKMILDWYLSLL